MSETTAMRKTIVTAIAAVFLCAGPVGCKTAAKMAWWKTGDKAGVESTALAHSAPSLPADVAKQAESYATSAPSIQMSGGEANPYSPAPAFSPGTATTSATPAATGGPGAMTASTAYPSTGALPYSAASTQAAAPAYASADRSADLGAVDMPYNPNAVPPAKIVATAPASAPATNTTMDRYAMAKSAPTYGSTTTTNSPPVADVAVPQFSSGGRYGKPQIASVSPTAPAPPTAPALPPAHANFAAATSPASSSISPAPVYSAPVYAGPGYSDPASTGSTAMATTENGSAPSPGTANDPTGNAAGNLTGSRYATNGSPTQSDIRNAAPVVVTPTAVVAAASPYRPAGTASYVGSAIEVASRPNSVETQSPNAATPSLAPEPSQAPRYR